MKVVSNISKATAFLLICFVTVNAQSETTCFTVNLEPIERLVHNYDYDFNAFDSINGVHDSDIMYHLFEGNGNVVVASNATSSSVCVDDDEEKCHYWFFHGNGIFSIVDDEGGETIVENEIYFDQPQLLPMGTCQHYCDDQQQLMFIGLKDDEPILYDKNNEVIPTLFLKMDDENTTKKEEENYQAVMKTSCIQPRGDCYNLVGSSLYTVSNSEQIVEEEGSTFHGSKTFGNKKECFSLCDLKPLLGDTRRGRDILQVAASVSGSDVLIDVETPQYMAACWLIHDDVRQLPAEDRSVLQRYILIVMYLMLGGEDWNNNFDFMTPKHECDWRKWIHNPLFMDGVFAMGENGGEGVHCDEEGYLTGLLLLTNNLVGELPFEMASLIHIEYLDISDNLISGGLPSELGTLQNLRYAVFQQNALTGSIPHQIGYIESMNIMILSDNFLTGTIPSLFQMDFQYLRLAHNMITGPVPEEVSSWSYLHRLELSDNHLSGQIPEDVGNLTSLEIMYLDMNNLVGTLPSKIFEVPRLEYLVLEENSLTGSLPTHVATTTGSQLMGLYLQSNHLSGTIPPELSLLSNLRWLDLDDNKLTGEMHSNITNLKKLERFESQNNDITGISPYHDCEQAPAYLEADCDTPRKVVSCPCCTFCHGVFTSSDDDGLVCPSGELTVIFEGLKLGEPLQFDVVNNATKEVAWNTVSAHATSLSHTSCVPLTGCFHMNVRNISLHDNFEMNLFINDNIVLEELTAVGDSLEFFFGYSSDGTIQRDSCDDFTLCDVTFEAYSTKRELLDTLTRVTGISVFDDTESSHHYAACKWVDYLEGRDDEEYKYSDLLQYFYLALLYYQTNGARWIDSDLWITNTTFCYWFGIECDGYGVVTSLQLPFNNLRGELPSEVGELRGIEYLALNNNWIGGRLPLEVGAKMTNLQTANISMNVIWGRIPEEFSQLVELVTLDAGDNQLTGSLPFHIGDLNKLEFLRLFNNTCAGSLPSSFYELTSLTSLSLGDNLFAGQAWDTLKLINLEYIDLSDNFFTGDIPLGNTQKSLRTIQYAGNQFRGSIPSNIQELTLLETFFIYNNRMTGNLPSQVGNLESLVRVSLSHNYIKGSVPSDIGKLKNLTLLHLQSCNLEGSGDFFDYDVGDYITDCGATFTSPARVACTNCTACCNVDGDCIRRDITWPKERLQAIEIKPQRFVFLMTLVGTMLLLIPIFAYTLCRGDNNIDYEYCREFQVTSVYKYMITSSLGANCLAIACVFVQLLLLSIFLGAADYTEAKNDWEYSMSCPRDSTSCAENRLVTDLAWFAYAAVLFSYLSKDFAGSVKVIHRGFLLKSCRCGFAGFTVLYVTVCSGVTSILYIYSTGISNTDILKDAVILLFLNEIDDRLYCFVKVMRPVWVRYLNRSIQEHLDDKIDGRSGTFCGRATDALVFVDEEGNVLQESHKNKRQANLTTTQRGDTLRGDTSGGDTSERGMGFGDNPEAAETYVRLMREHHAEIEDLRDRLTTMGNDYSQLQNNYAELQNAHMELQSSNKALQDVGKNMESKFAKEYQDIKTLLQQRNKAV